MQILSFLVFVVLQILFLPLAVLGVAWVAYTQMVVSKRIGVSQTAIEVINGRWTMHVFGMRDDPASAKLAAVLPNTSTVGLWLVLFPLWVKHKMSGTYFGYPRAPEEGAEGLGDIVVARTLYFDRIIEDAAGELEQFVVLGAGYDTRAYGWLKRPGLSCFEVDQPSVQRHKIESLKRAGIDVAHVRFVAVDFDQESACDKLRASGYDPAKKTLFLWEGVTLYLDESTVRQTLRDIRQLAAKGSAVVADLYAERLIRMAGAAGQKALAYTGEGFRFGLPFATDPELTLRSFVESEGMGLGTAFFLGRTHRKGPFMVVAEIQV